MPLNVGDPNVANYVNALEKRIEALEQAAAKPPKMAVGSPAAEKIAETKIEEVAAAKWPGKSSEKADVS